MERLLYNCSEPKCNIPSGVIYIGRGTIWGNDFIAGRDGTREEVIEMFRQDLKDKIRKGKITVEQLASLYGKKLLCHCYPQSCHGNVLIDASIWAYNYLQSKISH